MASVMFQFRHPGGAPTLDQVRTQYGLDAGDVDKTFGVVQTDSADDLYTVLVDDRATARIETALRQAGATGDPAVGVFSNPRVEPTGPGGRVDVTM
jgi:hypothetical protein